jgi:hypothetical protein
MNNFIWMSIFAMAAKGPAATPPLPSPELGEGEEEEPRVWPLPEKAEEEEEACLVIVFVRALLREGEWEDGGGRGEGAHFLSAPRTWSTFKSPLRNMNVGLVFTSAPIEQFTTRAPPLNKNHAEGGEA